MKPITKTVLLVLSFLVLSCSASQHSTPDQGSTLCVVRHAQAFKNLDPPPEVSPEKLDSLTSQGEATARALRDSLPRNVAMLWSSPTNRTRQTADLLGLDVPTVVNNDLRSLDGDMEWNDRVEAWSRGDDPRPPNGESLADGAERVRKLLARLGEELALGESAVVVTHKDISALFVGELQGTPLLERLERNAVETGEMVCLPFDPDVS